MIRCAILLAVAALAGCQITIDPVFDDYYGFRASVTWPPVVALPDPPDDATTEP